MDPLTSGLNTDDSADIDQFRPAKKMKLEAGSLEATEELKEEMADDDEDWDSIYGAPQASGDVPSATEQQIGSGTVLPMASEPAVSGTMVESTDTTQATEPTGNGTLPLAAPGESQKDVEEKRTEEGLHAEMIDGGDQLVAGDDPTMESTNIASTRMNEEITEHEDRTQLPAESDRTTSNDLPKLVASAAAKSQGEENASSSDSSSTDSSSDDSSSDDSSDEEEEEKITGDGIQPDASAQPIDDPDLMTAPDSDPEPDDDSDSDSDSDNDDDKVEPLDAAALAAMLMNEDGGDGGQSNGDHQPRTANERNDLLPTPEVTITPETKKTPLGKVSEHLVDQMALIPSSLAGSTQVLDFGSLLCNEELQVVGVVQDTIGRVQGPMYVTYCKDEEERQRLGLLPGAQIYYVDEHSKFVFTRNLPSKGTDASNIHDEEIDEDEQEFSDDEKEAEYKRMNKESKKAGNGKLSRGEFVHEAEDWTQQSDRGRGRGGRGGRGNRGRGRGGRFDSDTRIVTYGAPGGGAESTYIPNRGDKPQDNFTGGLNYDDDEPANGIRDPADGDYNKHVRPDNLAELMTRGGGVPIHGSRGRGDARGGRGRGDRGRGDRGKGRGGRGDRADASRGRGDFQRGGRGGPGEKSNSSRGSANSYPDAHNNDVHPARQQDFGNVNSDTPNQQPYNQASHFANQRSTSSVGQSAAPTAPPQGFDPQALLAQFQQQQAQSQQTYQFNGQQYQYPQQQSYANTAVPTGGYVNPAFHQQAQPQPTPQWSQSFQQWPPQPQGGAVQNQQWQAPGYQAQQTQQAQPGAGWYQSQQAPQGQDAAAMVQNALQFLQQNQQQGRQQ